MIRIIRYTVECPYCGRASTVSMYVEISGELRLDLDCPACGSGLNITPKTEPSFRTLVDPSFGVSR